MTFAVGQQWTYAAQPAQSQSRIIIGALLDFADSGRIACCTVTGAHQKQPDGTYSLVTIPFLPMTLDALERTVIELDGEGGVADEFLQQFDAWHDDERGLSYFTVPFEGSLERMIAMQMSDLVGS